MSENDITDKKLLELWSNPHFEASFRGVNAFQTVLKTNFNIDVPQSRLLKLFKSQPLYLIHQKRKLVKRRKYDVKFYGEIVQADLAYMYDYNGFRYFLLVVDCFSSKLFVEPLKKRDSLSVTKAFKTIFKEFKSKIYKLESDRGSEFESSTKKFFRQEKIYHKAKFGRHKANYAERYIYFVKRRLYMILRSELSENWVKYIKIVVDQYNKTPLEKLGYLKPNDIKSETDSVSVQLNKKQFGIKTYSQPDFRTQEDNVEVFKSNTKKLQLGDFCYKFFDEKLFDKKYNISVMDSPSKSFTFQFKLR